MKYICGHGEVVMGYKKKRKEKRGKKKEERKKRKEKRGKKKEEFLINRRIIIWHQDFLLYWTILPV
ncbi:MULTISPECIES: hypothetical protein [unclassified Arenibacter]|uniref:hypothetical protein n=1 Tax=unclassified Arenibacter TaxID=2615047 RepID=UPI000E34E82B|nr:MULTISPECIES: hypothetical protein [unclassified Arenibacter]MCM4164599.1 hypothetical protein [Arenibacter sp. A80]RFT55681.1 hypothetical protein D0S24_13420 [Arenibacter sp. P308M17]